MRPHSSNGQSDRSKQSVEPGSTPGGALKRCSRCKKTRSLSEFNRDSSRKDGLQHRCKGCHAQLSSSHYHRNKSDYLKRQSAKKEGNYHLIRSLKSKPCADCEIEYAPWMMQFDHTSNDKRIKISAMRGYGEKAIRDEAEKCDVVCANCHAHRTYLRQGRLGLHVQYKGSYVVSPVPAKAPPLCA